MPISTIKACAPWYNSCWSTMTLWYMVYLGNLSVSVSAKVNWTKSCGLKINGWDVGLNCKLGKIYHGIQKIKIVVYYIGAAASTKLYIVPSKGIHWFYMARSSLGSSSSSSRSLDYTDKPACWMKPTVLSSTSLLLYSVVCEHHSCN